VRVPRFEPFAALRYSPSLPLDDVSAPPYDVLSEGDVDALAARHPDNIVAIDVPRESDGEDRYEQAGRRLRQWVLDGVMVRDPAPAFTIYRMRFSDPAGGPARETIGVVGALEVVDEGAGGVLPHERTTPKAKSDRLDLTRATHANLSPVWGLSLTAGLTDLLREPGHRVGHCTDEHGVLHSVERVDEPQRVGAIAAAVAANPVLIADGHHRYAVSRTFRDEVRREMGTGTDAELTLTYVGELVEDQLSIDAIHRLYRGMAADDLLRALSTYFATDEAGTVDSTFAATVVDRGSLCLVRPDGTGVWLRPRPEQFTGVRDLDGALLEHAVAGIGNAGGVLDVAYQHGIVEVLQALASGGADAAVLIRPTGITEIRRTADERLLMPPKSTFFTPKLRTGLVVRPLTLQTTVGT
jgi:uncharacterized protein (DUF1015 family)